MWAKPGNRSEQSACTITAYSTWTITWNVNGNTGTLPYYQSTSTELPVSELQVLVR